MIIDISYRLGMYKNMSTYLICPLKKANTVWLASSFWLCQADYKKLMLQLRQAQVRSPACLGEAPLEKDAQCNTVAAG